MAKKTKKTATPKADASAKKAKRVPPKREPVPEIDVAKAIKPLVSAIDGVTVNVLKSRTTLKHDNYKRPVVAAFQKGSKVQVLCPLLKAVEHKFDTQSDRNSNPYLLVEPDDASTMEEVGSFVNSLIADGTGSDQDKKAKASKGKKTAKKVSKKATSKKADEEEEEEEPVEEEEEDDEDEDEVELEDEEEEEEDVELDDEEEEEEEEEPKPKAKAKKSKK